MWRLWASALGEKSGRNDREANIIAAIRTLIFSTYLVTNVAIVANAVRHWDDNTTTPIEVNHESCRNDDIVPMHGSSSSHLRIP